MHNKNKSEYGLFGEPTRFWRNELSGQLPNAIHTYSLNRDITQSEIALIRDYLAYWINAPCWMRGDVAEQKLGIAVLATRVDALNTAQEIRTWLTDALMVGIDPL